MPGFSFLGDLKDSTLSGYFDQKLTPGSFVRIAFGTADASTLRAVATWSTRYAFEQKFIGHSSHSCRIGVKLQFGSEAERQRYLTYLSEARSEALKIKPGMIF